MLWRLGLFSGVFVGVGVGGLWFRRLRLAMGGLLVVGVLSFVVGSGLCCRCRGGGEYDYV